MLLERMGSDGKGNLRQYTESISEAYLGPNLKRQAFPKQPEIIERQPSSAPDPLSREWIFEPWPLLTMISDPATPVNSERTYPCPLFAPGCNCTALGGHTCCLFLRGESTQVDEANSHGTSMSRDRSSPLQTHNPWDTLGSQDPSAPSTTLHRSEPRNGHPDVLFSPGTLTDYHRRRTYSDPAIFEETAVSGHPGPSKQKSTQDFSQSYIDIDIDLSAMTGDGSVSLLRKLHGCVDQSSSGSAKREINHVDSSAQTPVPPSSVLGFPGRGKPQENRRPPEVEDPVASHRIQQPRKEHKPGPQSNYTREERKWVVYYLKGEVSRGNLTESKWDKVSRELVKHGLKRSKCSIKAWWSRSGREETGFDERRNPNGRNLVTSKQDPEDRKNARRLKKRQLSKEGPTMLDRDSEGPAASQCKASNTSSGPRL